MRIFLPIFLFFTIQIGAQSLHVANSYYKLGKFDNAVLAYESILEKNSRNVPAIIGLAKSYRQIEQLDKAETLLKNSFTAQSNQLGILLELGVTYNQKEQKELATQTFDKVILGLEEHPNLATNTGHMFKAYNLLSYTVKCFEKAMIVNPNYNYSLEVGRLYGEIGDLNGMYSSYLDYMLKNPAYINAIKRFID